MSVSWIRVSMSLHVHGVVQYGLNGLFPLSWNSIRALAEAPDVKGVLVCDGRVFKVYLGTTCLLVSQCYCYTFAKILETMHNH